MMVHPSYCRQGAPCRHLVQPCAQSCAQDVSSTADQNLSLEQSALLPPILRPWSRPVSFRSKTSAPNVPNPPLQPPQLLNRHLRLNPLDMLLAAVDDAFCGADLWLARWLDNNLLLTGMVPAAYAGSAALVRISTVHAPTVRPPHVHCWWDVTLCSPVIHRCGSQSGMVKPQIQDGLVMP